MNPSPLATTELGPCLRNTACSSYLYLLCLLVWCKLCFCNSKWQVALCGKLLEGRKLWESYSDGSNTIHTVYVWSGGSLSPSSLSIFSSTQPLSPKLQLGICSQEWDRSHVKSFLSYWKKSLASFNCSWDVIFWNTRLECSHLNIFKKAHYHLKAKETNEWWPGKSLWRWVKGAVTLLWKRVSDALWETPGKAFPEKLNIR